MENLDERIRKLATAFPRGTVLFKENDGGEHMYVILQGHVKIYRYVGNTEILLALLGPGDFFGEMALLEHLPRTAHAEVIQDSLLVEMDQRLFEEVLRSNSQIALKIMRKLSARVREADRRIQSLMMESGLGRVLEVLRSLIPHSTKKGKWHNIPPSLVCTIPQKSGLSLTAVESILSRLEGAGLVRRQQDTSLLVADIATFNDYNEYLALKTQFDPLTASELSSISGLPESEVHKVMQRILDNHLAEAGAHADPYQRYLSLKKRFEYTSP